MVVVRSKNLNSGRMDVGAEHILSTPASQMANGTGTGTRYAVPIMLS